MDGLPIRQILARRHPWSILQHAKLVVLSWYVRLLNRSARLGSLANGRDFQPDGQVCGSEHGASSCRHVRSRAAYLLRTPHHVRVIAAVCP